ncbi:glycosyltransferase family 2 protein [Fructilactobacillus sanfranciscensis]|uniref:glycosyltransferase family 2 protein n=1 Tax=Fructilactobacillus sanfranciscensis TaxID=1625 RepID=UPI0013D306A3|nr:glycosyltransferase family 2 protein [Fructilactobacillus sanfranciscensis]NDR77682.1 glycosyltransferase [Fructilactobacillus sanfranciscensis]
MNEKSVALVMVTYNRLELLKGALETIFQQTTPVDGVFVINNHSTDGTEAYLATMTKDHPNLFFENLTENIGGAGGFNVGMKFAYQKHDYDFYWLMDDDTYPSETALAELLKADNEIENVGFLSSDVVWNNGSPVKMNVPVVSTVWNDKVQNGLVGLKSGSFVSMLISKAALHKVGLPIKEFFIWGDDMEYSRRISKYFSAYFVSGSVVTHKTGANNGVDILSEKGDRIQRYYYDNRNQLYMAKKQGFKQALKFVINRISLSFKILFSNSRNKINKIAVICKGVWAGLFFNPQIEYIDDEK